MNVAKNIKFISFFLFLMFLVATFFVQIAKTEASTTFTFTQNLSLGTVSSEVKELQKFLNEKGYILANTGFGSKGNETTYFGHLTLNALIRFQKINNLVPDGIVGPKTRKILIANTIQTPIIKKIISGSIIHRDTKINKPDITGVTVPSSGATPTATVTSTDQYTATISWNGNPTIFTGNTEYTAIITITPKSGYTLSGITENYFNLSGAVTTNSANSGIVTAVFPATPQIQLTIADPTLTTTKTYDGDTTAVVTAGSLTGVISGDTVTVSAVATYDTASVGIGKTITVVYTLGGAQASNYIKPVNYTTSTGVINSLGTQATPTFSPVAGAIAFGTTVTISSSGADAIYYTTDGSDPTISSTNQATTPLVINSAITVKALAVKANYIDSAIGSAVYTQAYATVPSSIVLAVGSTAPVGGVTNVVIPAAGATDTTGAVSGWITSTADKIKFTVTDNGGASTITIGGAGYTSGDDYVIPSTSSLSIVVTTTEANKANAVRTFTVTVAEQSFTVGVSYQGGKIIYVLHQGDTGYDANIKHGLIGAIENQSIGIRWYNGSNTTTGATGTAIGTGFANTNTIISSQGETTTSYAAGLARAYNGGGYTDWYLPSKNELNAMYSSFVFGTFPNNTWFWSSSEDGSTNAWIKGFFSPGTSFSTNKSNTYPYVRAIRSF